MRFAGLQQQQQQQKKQQQSQKTHNNNNDSRCLWPPLTNVCRMHVPDDLLYAELFERVFF